MKEETRKVVICLHKNFVREHIGYIDKTSGEEKEFTQARIPHGTCIDGVDYGGWEFTPHLVAPSELRGENWRDITLYADQKLQLRRSVFDTEGNPILSEDGRRQHEHTTLDPAQLRDAIIQGRRNWAQSHAKQHSLSERAYAARKGSQQISYQDHRSQDVQTKEQL